MFEHRSGVYRIQCTLNNKSYIGSTGDIQKRIYEHLSTLRRGKHANSPLQADWNAYGEQSFTFELLEYVDDRVKRVAREQYHIDTLCPEYNIIHKATSNQGKEPTSPEGIAKMRKSLTGLTRTDATKTAIGNFHRGRKRSKATIEKMKQVKGQMSPETKARMAESARKRVERLGPPIKASQAGADATRNKPRDPSVNAKISQTKKRQFAEGQPLPNPRRNKKGQWD